MAEEKRFKVCIIGDAKVGKTTFLKRFRTGEFKETYQPTMGVEVYPVHIPTNHGKITLNIWDCAGEEKYLGLDSGYYIGANACVVMFDVTRPITYMNASKWHKKFVDCCEDAPVVMCGNKVDARERKVLPRHITYPKLLGLPYFDLSAKSCYNLEKPFLELLFKLTGHQDIALLEASAEAEDAEDAEEREEDFEVSAPSRKPKE